MVIIDTVEELAAIGGGRPGNSRLTCTVGIPSGVSCTGSAQAWGDVAFAAFDQLQSWGGDLGRAIYDWTH